MSEDFAWQFKLQGTPDEVFESLVRAAGGEGRLHRASKGEAALTYASTDVNDDHSGWIHATVRPCPEGALVDITPIHAGEEDHAGVASYAASVASLVGQLRLHYPDEIVVAKT